MSLEVLPKNLAIARKSKETQRATYLSMRMGMECTKASPKPKILFDLETGNDCLSLMKENEKLEFNMKISHLSLLCELEVHLS